MSFGPSGPYLKLKFVVIFQPIRELEFRGRLSDFFLSPQFAIKDQVCIQLSLLCETMTYFNGCNHSQIDHSYSCLPNKRPGPNKHPGGTILKNQLKSGQYNFPLKY